MCSQKFATATLWEHPSNTKDTPFGGCAWCLVPAKVVALYNAERGGAEKSLPLGKGGLALCHYSWTTTGGWKG
jgi:hypothetical protein